MTTIAAGVALAATFIGMAAAQELACERCHPEQSRSQPATPMAHAASRAADAEILKVHPALDFSSGGYAYTINRDGDRMKYLVTGGGKTFSADLIWAFGFGSMGQTYLYEYRGALYESKVSFYSALNGLDLTIGHRKPDRADLEMAAGRRVDKLEATRCFGCHTTGPSPGVRCARCHSDSERHTQRGILPAKLSLLSNEELSDFCGGCHRTWQDVSANGPHDINNVRFQPYRLATSKCYNDSVKDKRISCVGCHDPHQNVMKNAAYYDAKCQTCHQAGHANVCKVAQQNCVPCHMPKVEFPSGHFQFTDHRIRIMRGAAYPS